MTTHRANIQPAIVGATGYSGFELTRLLLSFQAEWNAAYISQIGGSPVYLDGMYVYASYFLTGEHREYIRRSMAAQTNGTEEQGVYKLQRAEVTPVGA